MAKAAYTGLHLSLVLGLFVLLSCLGSSQPADTHTLSCNSIVMTSTTPPQPWYEGQCSLDGEPFLQFDDNKATPLGDLGKEAHATQMWTGFVQELDFFGKELRKKLADTELETTKISGHPTLQAIMLSKCEQGQIVGASLLFNISGKYSFILNTMNMSWTPISLEARGIMNEWKDDEELTKYLKILMKNFCHWQKELLKIPRERTRSTSIDPDITQLPSTTQLPPTTKFQYEAAFTTLGLIFITIVFVCIWMCVKRKTCTQGEGNHQLPMNCSIICHKPQRKEGPMEPSGEFPNQATKMLSQEDEPKIWE